MKLQQRVHLLTSLGHYIKQSNDFFELIKQQAGVQNPWFTIPFINLALENIADNFLQQEKLEAWVKDYKVPKENNIDKTVGIVMAGNIPLVGFHDLICVFVRGFKSAVKLSSKDNVLIKHFVDVMKEWDAETGNFISFKEQLKGCDAYIATGSNNSGRYFEYYFGSFPHIIRRNRTSAAVLDGSETEAELDLLADDIQLYFGLGCRNVTKIIVPRGYDFVPLLKALKKYDYLADFHKYKHNFDYHLTLLIMNNKFYMTNESVILTENDSQFSPVSQVHYAYYDDKEQEVGRLEKDENIQCVVGHGLVEFGRAQIPSLYDYADRVDTMRFLRNLV